MSEKISKSSILIKGGKIVNDDHSFLGDVLIEDGKITRIDKKIDVSTNVACIDATNKLVLPGSIDLCTHFESNTPLAFQSIDDFNTGSKAAIYGGTTLIANCLEPVENQSYLEVFDNWVTKYESSLWCDYVIRVGLSWWSDGVVEEVETLVKEKGVTSFYIPPTTTYDDLELINIFHTLKKLGCVVFVCPYNQTLVQLKCRELIGSGVTGPEGWLLGCSEDIELQAIHRYISLADQVGVPLFITSVTNKKAAQLVAKKRLEGKTTFSSVNITSLICEGSKLLDADWTTAAHHLTLPPISMQKTDKELLLDYLSNNDIQTICSDHQSFTTEQKAAGKDDFRHIPHGVACVQELVEALWGVAVSSGKMDVNRFVASTSTFPAKLLNLYPTKGRIEVGSDADIIIIDSTKNHEFNKGNRITKSDFNVFEGLKSCSKIDAIVKSGVVVVHVADQSEESKEESVKKGAYIKCQSFPDVAYSRSLFKQATPTNGFPLVKREAYDGPISGQSADDDRFKTPSYPAGQRSDKDNFCRPPTKSGGRNMQDTTLSISVEGTYADDPIKCQKLGGYRVNQPPGGRTTQFW